MAVSDLSKLQKLKDLKSRTEVEPEVSETAANMALLTSFGSYTESVVAPKSIEDDLFAGASPDTQQSNIDVINSLEDDIFGGQPVPETISQLESIENIEAAKEDSIDKIIQSLQTTQTTSINTKVATNEEKSSEPKTDPMIKSYSLEEPDSPVKQVTKARKKVKASKGNKSVFLEVSKLEASLFLISNYLKKNN
jgi:hypothetical protein